MAKTIPLGEITGSFHCGACEQKVSLSVDESTDEASCKNCGASFGPYGPIRDKFFADAKAAMRRALKRRR